MRRVMWLTLVAALLAGAMSVSAEEDKIFGVVVVGPVDGSVAQRAIQFARGNSAIPIQILPMTQIPSDDLNSIGIVVGENLSDHIVGAVVFAWPSIEISAHGVFLPEDRVAVVNVQAIKPADGDMERFGRRMERELMQGLGMVLGVKACPNPQCAMWAYSSDEELDAMGRNYCPPCLEQVLAAAEEKGLKLDDANPFSQR